MSEIKRMSIKEFQEKGFLQEANRNFFHPLGLALEILVPDDENEGEYMLGGIWDYRDDPEGMLFGAPPSEAKADNVRKLWNEHADVRIKKYGWVTQPCGVAINERPSSTTDECSTEGATESD